MPAESTPLVVRTPSASGAESSSSAAVIRASWLIEEATQGFPPRRRGTDTGQDAAADIERRRTAYLLSQEARAWLLPPGLVALVLLNLFETPLWCRSAASSSNLWQYVDPSVTCHPAADPASQIYLSGILYLPPAVGVVAEVLVYAVLLSLMALEFRWRGSEEFLEMTARCVTRTVLLLVSTVDAAVYACLWQDGFRLAPYTRLGVLVCTEPLLTTFSSTARTVPSYLRILLILVGTYAFLGFVFSTLVLDYGRPLPECVTSNSSSSALAAAADCPRGNNYFTSLGEALYSFSQIAANQGTPDRIIPTSATHRVYELVWIAVFVLMNLVLLNVVLATVFSAYQLSFKQRTIARFKNRALGLGEAFEELVAERAALLRRQSKSSLPTASGSVGTDMNALGRADLIGVARPQFRKLVAELNRTSTVRFIPDAHLDYLFSTLDDDGDGIVHRHEFCDLADSLDFHYTRCRTQSYVERTLPAVWAALRLERVKQWTESPRWYGLPKAMVLVMVANTATIFTQQILSIQHIETVVDAGKPTESDVPLFTWLYFGFSCFYLLELSIQLTVQPWTLFFVLGSRVLDVSISVLVSLVSILWVLPFVEVNSQLVRYANMVRVLKLVNLVYAVSSDFTFVANSLSAIIRGSANVLGQLFLWIAFFVALGVQLFGGTVFATNPALANTDYLEDYYSVLNFNDFAMGFLPLVETLVAGGPDDVMIRGFGDAIGNLAVSTTFFLAFYYTTNLLMMNVFIAFVVSAYSLRFEAREERAHHQDGSGAAGGGGDGDDDASADDSDALGLDKSQRAQLSSLYAALPSEPGWTVVTSGSNHQDVLLRRMFREEIDEAIREATAELERRSRSHPAGMSLRRSLRASALQGVGMTSMSNVNKPKAS